MAFLNNGVINNDLWKSKEWEKFYMKNLDLQSNIKSLFLNNHQYDNSIRLTTEFIAEQLNKEPKFVHLQMAIWKRHHCTFYKKFGVVDFDEINKMWIYKMK